MGIRIFISKCKANTTMYSKLAISACLLAVAAAIPAGPPAPGYAPADPILPPVYNYEYGVNDPNYGPVFSQKESRDNYDTAGEYRVNLPDGRVQIVSYSAGPDGYVADVKYEGEATYPDHVPAPHPAPVHKPAPGVHKPAPSATPPLLSTNPLPSTTLPQLPSTPQLPLSTTLPFTTPLHSTMPPSTTQLPLPTNPAQNTPSRLLNLRHPQPKKLKPPPLKLLP